MLERSLPASLPCERPPIVGPSWRLELPPHAPQPVSRKSELLGDPRLLEQDELHLDCLGGLLVERESGGGLQEGDWVSLELRVLSPPS